MCTRAHAHVLERLCVQVDGCSASCESSRDMRCAHEHVCMYLPYARLGAEPCRAGPGRAGPDQPGPGVLPRFRPCGRACAHMWVLRACVGSSSLRASYGVQRSHSRSMWYARAHLACTCTQPRVCLLLHSSCVFTSAQKVIPIPDTSRTAALQCAYSLDKPYACVCAHVHALQRQRQQLQQSHWMPALE